MPSQVHPVGPDTGMIRYRLSLKKGDGSPGEVEAPPVFTLADPSMFDMEDRGLVEPGIYEVALRHNGSVGMTTITASQVDGDIGTGEGQVNPIGPFTDTVEAVGVLGAESAEFSALPEEA